MVASTHWLASGAGMAVLEKGGNAFDAAVAAGLVLQVVEPHLNGPGGELPAVFYSAERDETLVLNGQGPAPATASIERFRAAGLDLVPGTGLLAACVPGAFDAWLSMLREFGTLRLRDVMGYAIDYAAGGYPVVARISEEIAGVEHLFRARWPSSTELFLANGGPPKPGTLLRNPPLAATYGRILEEAEAHTADRDGQIDHARDLFYRGFVAEAIVEFATTFAGDDHKGLLDADDLSRYRARLEAPTTLDFRGYTVCKTGPWGQGPVLLQQLALLDGFDLEAMGPASARLIHTVVECAKLAFADREAWYGDPERADVPLDVLLSRGYAAERRRLVSEEASLELRPGTCGEREPVLVNPTATKEGEHGGGDPTLGRRPARDGLGRTAKEGADGLGPTAKEGAGDTCHLDVVDRHGNLVSATPSGGWLQSSPVIPGLGFPLGTRAQMFWLTEGHPNSLEGGKRPRTTLSPSLALRGGDPYLAFGTPGGDQQDQWPLVFWLNHVVYGMNLQEAIDAPSWHTEHCPSSFYPRQSSPGSVSVEGRVGSEVVDDLRGRGHRVTVEDDWSLGRISAAGREGDSGIVKAAANARGMQGYAVGR
jgi:gamma-glutamyltranspeptidase / glutathione hydrolase